MRKPPARALAAVIIVHETKPAAYGWSGGGQLLRRRRIWGRRRQDGTSLHAADPELDHSLDTAIDLFRRAGLDYYA